jgi:hypothetical protein
MLPLIIAHLLHGTAAHTGPVQGVLPAAAVHGAVPPSHAAHAVAVPAHASLMGGDLGVNAISAAPAMAVHVAHLAAAPAHVQAHGVHTGLVHRSK